MSSQLRCRDCQAPVSGPDARTFWQVKCDNCGKSGIKDPAFTVLEIRENGNWSHRDYCTECAIKVKSLLNM
jgi:ribosomal protein S26